MRIAIVNHRILAVESLRRIVTASGRHSIAWVADEGQAAVSRCAQDRPDLILMELLMPVMDGNEAIERIMRDSPCAILVVTAYMEEYPDNVFRALRAGALDAVKMPLGLVSDDEPHVEWFLEKLAMLESWSSHGKSVLPSVSTANDVFSRSHDDDEPLVVMGASAGGPNALAQLLAELPANFFAPVVVVQHLDARFVPSLVDWLQQKSRLPVAIVTPCQPPKPGHVLIACTDDHLVMGANRCLVYSEEPRSSIYKPSIDLFFDSVVKHWVGPIAGVILSGMGSDGARGLGQLKNAGHFTLAQDSVSCDVYGMPQAAFELKVVDKVANPGDIASELMRWCNRLAKN